MKNEIEEMQKRISNINTPPQTRHPSKAEGNYSGAFKPGAYKLLTERGFIHSTTHPEELKKALESGPITFYLGIDPTADNLHIGHFFALQIFKILQDHGHNGILLIGNATAMIGDPSFKNDMRKMMTQEEVDHNASEIRGLLSRFIDIEKATVVYNADWMKDMNYVSFMRNIGTHFNVAKMLAAECYKNRIREGGLTFLEMGYMLMQSYDFVHLNNKYNCTLQIGGSDQWGNIVAGTDLGRKMSLANGKERPIMIGLCCPLLIKADGTKMGKTEKGVLWVCRDKTSAFDCFQHFVNVFDEDVERLLTFFTEMPVGIIKLMCQANIIEAKKTMAYSVTKKIHGEKAACCARDTAEELFSKGTNDAPADTPTEIIDISSLSHKSSGESCGAQRAKSIKGPRQLDAHSQEGLREGLPPLVDILALTSIIKSKREARELITSGAILVDGEKITDINFVPAKKEFLVKKGKKTFLRILTKEEK